jgi:hypothetical protein
VAKSTKTQIEGFATDLGTLLGKAVNKAESWLSERETIVKQVTEVRDTASKLLADLGQGAKAAATAASKAYTGKRRGRPAGTKNQPAVRKRRKLSAKARKAISDAQKARWAKQKAGEKKK